MSTAAKPLENGPSGPFPAYRPAHRHYQPGRQQKWLATCVFGKKKHAEAVAAAEAQHQQALEWWRRELEEQMVAMALQHRRSRPTPPSAAARIASPGTIC